MTPAALTFTPAATPAQWQTVAQLANEIWPSHYTPIIGSTQVAYMLERFQSARAIAAQVAGGMDYCLIESSGEAVGYLAFELRGRELFLSKIYLRQSVRRGGLGRAAIDWLQSEAVKAGAESIGLTVNRHNQVALSFYRAVGFCIVGTQVAEIGNGYVMDDYLLQLRLENCQ